MSTEHVPFINLCLVYDDVIKWKHFLCYMPFVWGIHWSSVNSAHKGQWRGALIFSLICAARNGRVNNRDTVDWRRHRTHYDVTVMYSIFPECKRGDEGTGTLKATIFHMILEKKSRWHLYLSIPIFPTICWLWYISFINSLRPSDAYMRQ